MKSTKRLFQLSTAVIFTLFLLLPGVARTEEGIYNDALSLHGITEAKSYFSIDTTLTPERLPMILYGILVTHGSLVQQGVSPDFIVGFWGTNLALLTESADPMVKDLLQQLDALGVRLEICYAAMQLFGVSPADVLPELDIVGSVWISQVAYTSKSKGYARIDF